MEIVNGHLYILEDQSLEPLSALALTNSENFMKANPDNRWRKMPPGSAESLPPSNAKPYTPSLSNGVACGHGKLLTTSSLPGSDPSMADQDQTSVSQQPSAPKPFKKRYLASNASNQAAGPSATPPSPSPVAGVSPDAATACEALMELSRTDSRNSRSSDGSSSNSNSGSERRGSPSETQQLQTLREAVWSKVATTLKTTLKQEEEKLVEPPKDSPMNLSQSQQCTIRGQQIIEHIIENILDKPMEGHGTPCEPINVSVNNNQDEGIKASIYESLKNDLLKNKMTSSKSAPPTPPGPSPGSVSVSAKVTGQNVATPPSTKASPVALVVNQASTKMPVQKLASVTTVSPSSSSSSSITPGSHSPNSVTPPGGHQDVLRLLARNSQVPINVGNSAITITKTPRVPQTQPSAPSIASVSPTPVSVSLTRTGSNQVFNLSAVGGTGAMTGVPVVLSSQPGVMLAAGQTGQGGVTVLTGMTAAMPGSECVLLSPASMTSSSPSVILQQAGGHTLQQGQPMVLAPTAAGQPLLIAAGSKLILAPPVQQQQHGSPRPVHSSSNSVSLVQQQNHTGASVSITNTNPVTNDSSDPVNLTVSKPAKSPMAATLKRPASISDGDDEDIRRSGRQSKGKRYQEFIEDGRINVGSKLKRRSHRSGDGSIDGEQMELEPKPLVQTDLKFSPVVDNNSTSQITNNQINHWKEKLRTVSLGDNNTHAHVTGASTTVALTAHTTANSTSETSGDRDRHYHRQIRHPAETDMELRNNHRASNVPPRSTRQSHHQVDRMSHAAAAASRSYDVKVGTKKLRGEKISH